MPSATAEPQFEFRDVLFKGSSKVMTNLKSSRIGLLFLRRNSSNLDMRQGLLNFASLSMQLKHADNTHSNINEPLLTPTGILIQPRKQTVIYINPQVHTENWRIGHDSTLFWPRWWRWLHHEPNNINHSKQTFHSTQLKRPGEPLNIKKVMPHCYLSNTDTRASEIYQTNQPAALRHLLEKGIDYAMQYVNAIFKMPKSEESIET